MAEQQTCGRALAEQSKLPAKLAALFGSAADNLEAHIRALDMQDEHARDENAAYHTLTAAHRELAERLRATSADMASYQNLPTARHEAAALAAPDVSDAFDKFVTAERDLLELLQVRVTQDEATLQRMHQGGGAGEAVEKPA